MLLLHGNPECRAECSRRSWSTETGLEYVLVNANLDIVSLKTALCDVSNNKKARYSSQVLACCLHRNLVKVHSDSGSSLTLEAWAELKCKYILMFKYMYMQFRGH